MVTIRCRVKWREIYQRVRDYIVWKYQQILLTFHSLSYNAHMSRSYAVDCLLEPIFWFVDNFSGSLGKVFVFCVTVLTSAVVAIAYWIGLPYWWHRNPYLTVFLVIFGNWLLLNIVFHYYMAVTTSPGQPPHGAMLVEAAGICKKCISPKPPRTHHCSVCDKCILAMDHHCPWLNNCVGYFNARYFYLYMAYMVAGVTFVIVFGLDIGYVVIWINDPDAVTLKDEPELIGHPLRLNQSGVLVPVKDILEYDSENSPREHILPTPLITEAQLISADPWKRKAVIFVAVACIAVFIALGALVVMHTKNIGKGETSIEAHINAAMRKQNPNFRNPYNLGKKKNWRIFLGLTQGRTFIKHVLFPSRHTPVGSGLTWHAKSDLEDWP
ncbi:palmitoyltransferase ZDHHC16B [Colias croceus]|uniref:palmitoyltransferase ZDHHC16B n=1 Tax=Colias crocea TaxID=72248 RepID=UPI001E27B829|nr:palmitoyltransferase ZDHHC16B [Colias croceus]